MKFLRKYRKMCTILISTLVILVVIAGLALFMVGCQAGSLASKSEYNARYEQLPNFRDGRFVNFEPAGESKGSKSDFSNTIAWLFGGSRPEFTLPDVKLKKDDFPATPAELKFYWMGHSTLIMEIEGIRILSDPVFGSPGPIPGMLRRFQPSPLAREDLPPLDLVLLTHDHYDHLEQSTMKLLRESSVKFVVPLGVGDRLKGWGISADRITELNWDQSFEFRNLKITAVTSRHFSGRNLTDRDRTLWASYVIAGQGNKVFLTCDGGYGKHFKNIGEQHGPFDVAFLEIGAWDLGWPDVHLFPEGTVQALLDLKGNLLIPIHYAAFDLALHRWDEPLKRVIPAAAKENIRLYIPMMGETIDPAHLPPQKTWWIKPEK